MSDDPFAAIFSPITMPMGMLYDGVYHTTGATAQDISGALDGALAVTGAATGAVSAYQGSSAGNSYRAPSNSSSGSTNISSNGGYSQRGAFEECARVYQQAGRPDLAQQCANNANSMSSMRPVR